MPSRVPAIVLGWFVLAAPLLAQAPARLHPFAQIPEPPVPADPLELVSNAQPVQDVAQRADIVNLLEDAHQHSNVRAQPYDLKTTFTVSGSLSSGVWQEEDASPGKKLYRWTIQGPGYSAVNLNANRIFYSSQSSGAVPLRVMQFREAIFFNAPVVGPRATLRTANASLNGTDLTCALVSHNNQAQMIAGGRQWTEEEYCVNPVTKTMVTYSPAPGLYYVFDYSKALPFHNKVIPNGFTLAQAGQKIIEAQIESVSDPPDNPALFQPAGLNQIGVGGVMTPAWRMRTVRPLASGAAGATAQVVALHGLQGPSGQLSDIEVLASSDPGLTPSALEWASKWQGTLLGEDSESGATPQSHEVIVTVEYFSRGK